MNKLELIFLGCVFIALINSCNTNEKQCECEKTYLDSIFKNKQFYDTINPQYPVTVSISKNCYKINNAYYKQLFIKDSLYGNDTIDEVMLIRSKKHILYGYDKYEAKEHLYLNMEYKTIGGMVIDYSPWNLSEINYKNNDTVLNFTWIGTLGKSRYYFQFSKTNGLISMYRTYDGPFSTE